MVDILALCVLEIKDLSFLMASKKLSLWYQSKSPAPNDANLGIMQDVVLYYWA